MLLRGAGYGSSATGPTSAAAAVALQSQSRQQPQARAGSRLFGISPRDACSTLSVACDRPAVPRRMIDTDFLPHVRTAVDSCDRKAWVLARVCEVSKVMMRSDVQKSPRLRAMHAAPAPSNAKVIRLFGAQMPNVPRRTRTKRS
jgi:hypothetical protein